MSATTPTALIAGVAAVDAAANHAAVARQATLAKPVGSLGRLEDLGGQLAAIAGTCPPPVPVSPAVIVAAADHGVHAQGITPWPQRMTTQMVELFCAGGACVNALAHAAGASVTVIDVGCAVPPAAHPALRSHRVRAGTADLTTGPAMSRDEAVAALTAGATVTADLLDAGADLVVTGDMGIASTTATACLVAALTGSDAADVTGPGAGVVDRTLVHKTAVVADALARHRPDPADALGVLAAVGGLEHAALVGVVLAATARRVPVVLDGVITDASALITTALAPAARDYLIASHRSPEPAASVALAALGLEPLLDLGMRLGEGSGGALAVPLVRAAARVLHEVATLDELGPPPP